MVVRASALIEWREDYVQVRMSSSENLCVRIGRGVGHVQ